MYFSLSIYIYMYMIIIYCNSIYYAVIYNVWGPTGRFYSTEAG